MGIFVIFLLKLNPSLTRVGTLWYAAEYLAVSSGNQVQFFPAVALSITRSKGFEQLNLAFVSIEAAGSTEQASKAKSH